MTLFKCSRKFWVLLGYGILLSAALSGRVHGQENGALNLADHAGIHGVLDVLFPETDAVSLPVIGASILWLLVGLGAEFTHRYPKWHRIVDGLFLVFVVVAILVMSQQHMSGQLSPNAIFRLLPYMLFLFVGVIIGYALRKLRDRGTVGSGASA